MSQNNNLYKRGSIWRRWDLHIHTPGTIKNDKYDGEDLDKKWDLFVKNINEYDGDISVIGITDYLSTDNFEKFNTYLKDNKITKKFDLTLPNVELRIQPVTGSGSPVNIHCIFNPEISSQLNDRFFAKLKINQGSDSFSATKSELIRLGKKHLRDQNADDETAYKRGIEQFVLPFESLKNVFKDDAELRKNTFIVVSNRDHDGASGVVKHSDLFTERSGSQLDSTRWDIYQFSDAIFSSNENDRSYFLAEGADGEEVLTDKCGGKMACIHGCDAHSNDKIFEPDDKKYCWIKSDPTFEGLQQIKYEPGERVRICELEPEKKNDYLVIDKVNFIDDSFMPEEILLNSNLTTIIGGKSTGKSILLRTIARAVDNEEVNRRLQEVEMADYEREIQGFEVKWNDNQISKLNEPQDSKRIIYIPQSYLNRLIDKKEDVTSIDEIIKNVLLQEPTIKAEFQTIEEFERNNQLEIAKLIEDLFFIRDDLFKQSEKIKRIGDQKGIEEEIKKTESEINNLQTKSGVSSQEIDKYKELYQEVNELKSKIKTFDDDLGCLLALKTTPPALYSNLDQLSPSVKSKLEATIKSISLNVAQVWQADVLKQIEDIKKEKVTNVTALSKKTKEIQPLKEKIEKLTIIKEKTKHAETEKEKLKLIIDEIQKFKELKEKYNGIIETVKNIQSSFFEQYNKSRSVIKGQRIIKDDLSFELDIVFRSEHFQKYFVEEVCNLKTLNSFKDVSLNSFSYQTIAKYSGDMEKIIKGILAGSIQLKNNYSKKEALAKLLQNWFIYDFQVIHSGDNIASMSSGKKSFVLLKLLVELDQSKCPILLDQPEDDLDNRSIYEDLVKFIAEKKKERQIIVATHNPNLVVGADSEEVIVANQNGSETKNTNDYQFEYISGSLENTYRDPDREEILLRQGIQEHVCDILEGGKEAFVQRENRYGGK